MKRLVSALALALMASSAVAQPGPGPQPQPGCVPGAVCNAGILQNNGTANPQQVYQTVVNFNSANTDFPVTIALPLGYTRYRVTAVWVSGASASISSATFGLYTAAAAGGTGLIVGAAPTLTASSENTNNNLFVTGAVTNSATQDWTLSTLYIRVGTAQGSAATATVSIQVLPLS